MADRSFGRTVGVTSLFLGVVFSTQVVGAADQVTGWFRSPSGWVRWTVLVVMGLLVVGSCWMIGRLTDLAGQWRRNRFERVREAECNRKHDHICELTDSFLWQIRRFWTELAIEKLPDHKSLRQHLESDTNCLKSLEIMQRGCPISFRDLDGEYDAERELFQAAVDHYRQELSSMLRAKQTPRERIAAAAFGAKCVELLATQMRGLL